MNAILTMLTLIATATTYAKATETLQEFRVNSKTETVHIPYKNIVELKSYYEKNRSRYFEINKFGILKKNDSKSNLTLRVFIDYPTKSEEISNKNNTYDIDINLINNTFHTNQPPKSVEYFAIIKFNLNTKAKQLSLKEISEIADDFNSFQKERINYINKELGGSWLQLTNMEKQSIGDEIVIQFSDRNYLKKINQEFTGIIEDASLRVKLGNIQAIKQNFKIDIDFIMQAYTWKSGVPLPKTTNEGVWIPLTYWKNPWRPFSKKGYITPQYYR
jgi:hypothetical protein